MYREPNDRRWHPATVIQQLPEKRSHIIKTHDNVMYRKMQVHVKPYKPKKNIQQPEISKVIITKVWPLTRDLNMLSKHHIHSIYDSNVVHAYAVGCLTMLKMSYILLPQHVKRNTFLYVFRHLPANWLTAANNCITHVPHYSIAL